ncbi:MAG: phosphatidylglycerophosphatase A [Gammaproteobacteria bacterium]|jgi:phosphatidylglycerophosphatase A|nr:phosphatidylglycerophosphatase A [Gammaproteobacteria bacterium]MDP6616348.1 phosphatidylglycerophosphatase A [Gammaproteobacteria bacterium]MDP6695896.1 phosphatidylglycerophosphatase A [Gammaproteobacteria bacterium]MDP7041361.1 phosphatidylglycerophosphatase A [Gammaproteobacteria bacterium]
MKHSELVRLVLKDPLHWPAFGFGLGLMPFAPGTWGSLFGIAVWWATPKELFVQLVLAALIFLAGIWITGASARRIGVHDHPGIVWDEVLGMYLVLITVPPKPLWILTAFGFFRLADIWKPWPIRDLDHRLHGGLGIMLDDVIAALYAAAICLFLQYFLL